MISQIQHFEADFLWKVSLKILNSSINLKTFTQAHKAAHHPLKCDIINEVKLFQTVYCMMIDCSKIWMLSNQMSHYNSKCIRINIEE